ncbi:cytochrome P450 CYP749A22-like [Mercurialis annua]|uniref:cytochrome P450 CYP749A22-like n=1 Tax=Mercurialis annua TaxID=3986 RepID=UPI00215EE450|nr:cytochrome P450 CYP749A22-like [Mercurialis annua]
MGSFIIYLTSSIGCLFVFRFLIRFLMKVWWTPIRIQSMLRSQGIDGPSYKFIHGNSKEIAKMEHNASSNPIELSHHLLFPTVLPHTYQWTKLYGKNFLSWHGPQARFVTTESNLIKEIFNNRDGIFPKREPDVYVRKLLGYGLVTATAENWFKQRKISNQAFHAESLKGMIPGMIASVETMLERWENEGSKEIDVYKEFKILTSEIISRTAFGSSYLEGQHIFDMLMRFAVIISKNKYEVRIPGIRNLVKTQDDIESKRLEQGVRKSFINMIKKREEAAMMDQSANRYGTDFLGLMLKAHHEADKAKNLSLDDLIDECKTFYVAGHETTASLLTWIILLLAMHQDWQDKARDEILEIFGRKTPFPDGLTRLKIVSMIINETLRLYPPAILLDRKIERKVTLGKLILPADIIVEVPILAIHHNPEIWGEDAHQFKPERFAEGVAKATNNNAAAFLTFGLGARNCVGSSFTVTETKIALSMILQRYSFSLSPSYVHSPFVLLTLSPKHGLPIIIQKL